MHPPRLSALAVTVSFGVLSWLLGPLAAQMPADRVRLEGSHLDGVPMHPPPGWANGTPGEVGGDFNANRYDNQIERVTFGSPSASAWSRMMARTQDIADRSSAIASLTMPRSVGDLARSA